MRARAFLARSKLGGRLGRGDRDVGPNLESSLTFRPAWGRIATRFETLRAPALGGSPGRSAIVDRLAGTDRKRHRPRSTGIPATPGWQRRTDPNQTFTATSSNPDIKVSVAQGQFWTVTVSHTPANSSDVTINNESMTFQLFGDLTPQTVARIATLTNDNYYTTATLPSSSPAGPGKFIPRITSVSASGVQRPPGRLEQPDQYCPHPAG